MPILLLLLLLSLTYSIGFGAAHSRRILHQPLFPLDSFPPSQPHIPSPPKYPFSGSPSNNDTSFFPFLPSPPPPPSLASFPANIAVPRHGRSKSASSELIAAAVVSVVAAVVIVSLAIFLHLRKRTRVQRSSSNNNTKTQRSDDSSTARSFNHNGHLPKIQRPSQTSAEFLYLGTLVNSQVVVGGIGYNETSHRTTDSNASGSRKWDSPDLRPLPPLNTQLSSLRTNADVASSRGDDEEEFFSPKDFSSISIGTGSVSRKQFAAIEVENLVVSASNTSSTSSVSGSEHGSPMRSVSLSLSPVNSGSPRNSILKSPDLIEIQATVSFPPETRGLVFKESPSPSSPSLSSSEIGSRRSVESSPSISNVESPVKICSPLPQNATIIPPPTPPKAIFSPPVHRPVSPPSPVNPPEAISSPPPPPPPPPMSKVSESPKTPTPPPKKPILKPPALLKPLTPVSMESPTLISPIELPSNQSESVENKVPERFDVNNEETTPKPKLKPLHWDKVRAISDREMVWDQLKCSSFKLNEEMIETLFVVDKPKPSPKEATRWQVLPLPGPDTDNRVLDPKKAQNIAILLRGLNVSVEEVCEGLLEGNADIVGTDLLESLLKMAPTKEEERKLKEHKDDSPVKLGAAEKFLKAVVDIPFAFKRVEAMLYISNFDSEVEYLKKSFQTLEAACEELRTSRMFLKLLEAVLKTGNRMNVGTNRGDAHAFKLDTLLKLVDVKAADGKTTLLHFVVQEIIRSEGARLSNENQPGNSVNDETNCKKLGLQVVSRLSSELWNVKKAASMDAEALHGDVSKLSRGIGKMGEVAGLIESLPLEENTSYKFSDSMQCFMKKAENEIIRVQAQESLATSLVKEITEYFHGNSAKEEAHPFRIFMVVRDFLIVLDRVCKEVWMINEQKTVSSAHKFPVPVNPMLQPVIVGFQNGRPFTSSNDQGSSP